MLQFKDYQKTLNQSEDISSWTSHPHTQLGSNPGGVFTSGQGEKHYVKFYHNPEQAKAEVASAHVYETLGVPTLKPKLVNHKGHVGVASKWREDMSKVGPEHYKAPSEDMKHQLAKHYVAGILTKNWDAVGSEYDNLMHSKERGLTCVDLGGALHFRAMGGPKHYDGDIGERKSYHDTQMNRPTATAFQHVSDDHARTALRGMMGVHEHDIAKTFHGVGLKNAAELTASFVSRRDKLKADLKL